MGSDRKIATFLSGGLDSSLITALVNKYNPYTVNTYSVGMEGATDFAYAKQVAEHLKTNHNEILFTQQQGIDAVERVIYELESFDVKRVDRTVSTHGLEVRVPFLDKKFIRDFFTIDPKLRSPAYKGIEKYLIRKAFDDDNLLPSEVLWRTKEAMSDGVSSQEESWHSILGRYVETIITDKEYESACN